MFATVIALTKDLPDVVGDRQHGIQTFATILGAPRLTALGAHLTYQPNPHIDFKPHEFIDEERLY